MSTVEPGASGAGLVGRVRDLLLRPGETWDRIAGEPASIRGLYLGYVMPLAAIPVVAGAIGKLVFGVGVFGISYHPPVMPTIVGAVLGYLLSLASVYVCALTFDALAPSFGGTKDRLAAFKVAAYAPTAAWVVGIFAIFPPLGILGVLGLYSLYLLYVGLPKLMRAPGDKALGYVVVSLIVSAIVWVLAATVTAAVSNIGATSLMMAGQGRSQGTLSIPGNASVDLGKLEEASKQIEAAARRAEAGEGVAATDPGLLQAYLPASVAGYSRTDLTTSEGGVAGIEGSQAEATYSKGASSFQLSINDLGSAGALAGIAGALNINTTQSRDGKSAKVTTTDGRMTAESFDAGAGRGEYMILVGQRFAVAAEGQASLADLKAAVAAIDTAKLEALAEAG